MARDLRPLPSTWPITVLAPGSMTPSSPVTSSLKTSRMLPFSRAYTSLVLPVWIFSFVLMTLLAGNSDCAFDAAQRWPVSIHTQYKARLPAGLDHILPSAVWLCQMGISHSIIRSSDFCLFFNCL